MEKTYFLLIPLLVLFALGVLASSTKSFVGKYGDDSKLVYLGEDNVSALPSWATEKGQLLGQNAENGIITFAASYLIWFMFFGLGILWVIDGKIKKEQVIHALVASFLAWIATEFFKQIFHIPRPYQLNGFHPLTVTVPQDFAFPSSHAALAFALAVTIWFHDRKVGIVFILLAVLVGIARVAADVHYPIDILAGATIGFIVALLTEKVHFLVRTKK